MPEKCLMLLQSLILNWPIIKAMGFYLTAPILIVVPDLTHKNRLVNSLTINTPINVSIHEKCNLKKFFSEISSEPIFVDVTGLDRVRANKAFERLEMVLAASSGTFDGHAVNCLPILITTNRIPRYLMGKTSTLSISLSDIEKANIEDMVPKPSEFGLIAARVAEDVGYDETDLALLAAAYCCIPNTQTVEEKELLDSLRSAAFWISHSANTYENPEVLSEFFKKELYEWLNTNTDFYGYSVLEINKEALENADKAFYFHKEFVYISQSFFEKLSGNIIKAIGVDALKSALETSGVLETEMGAMNSRMYFSISGEAGSRRMLKLRLDMLEQAGEATLLDICIGRKGII